MDQLSMTWRFSTGQDPPERPKIPFLASFCKRTGRTDLASGQCRLFCEPACKIDPRVGGNGAVPREKSIPRNINCGFVYAPLGGRRLGAGRPKGSKTKTMTAIDAAQGAFAEAQEIDCAGMPVLARKFAHYVFEELDGQRRSIAAQYGKRPKLEL
jgi:hypothetical protein